MNGRDQKKISSLPVPETAIQTHQIFIRDFLVDMFIGVYDHEKEAKQRVRLNIDMTVYDHIGPINDDYHNVVCYETISNAIRSFAEKEHINLVETLAEGIADICLAHNRVGSVHVKVEKLNAVPNTTSVGVEISRSKP